MYFNLRNLFVFAAKTAYLLKYNKEQITLSSDTKLDSCQVIQNILFKGSDYVA